MMPVILKKSGGPGRTACLALGALALGAAAAALSLTASAALFLTLFSLEPALARPWTLFSYWTAYAGQGGPRLRALILGCALLPPSAAALLAWAALRSSRARPLHGAARFAARSEIRRLGLLQKELPSRSILVGKRGRDFLALPGDRFVMLAAPTRSGKGVGVVIPNCLTFGDSLIVLDIKEENFDLTSRCRRTLLGNDVYLFSPFSASGRTHCWNPLDAVSADPVERIGDIDAIAASLYSGGSDKDRFWSENAKDLFRGLCLLVLETRGIPHTMGEILRQASGKGQPLKAHVKALLERAKREGHPYSDACRDCLARVLQNGENTLASILSTFNVPMLVFQNPRVDAATSCTSPGLELQSVRRRRITVYLGVAPDRLAQARVLINLFFDQLLNLNTRTLPAQDPSLKHQCLLLLDEFTAAGRIPMISQAVAYMAGYGLRLLTIIQNKSQLEAAYGRAQSVTLRANHAMLVIFAPSPAVIEDAREASEMLGYATVQGRSRSRRLGSLLASGSESVSEQRRALMLPQELRELGPEREVLSLEGARPILAEKIRYYREPALQARLLGSIRDEIPVIDAAAHVRRLQQNEVRAAQELGARPADPGRRQSASNPLDIEDPVWRGTAASGIDQAAASIAARLPG